MIRSEHSFTPSGSERDRLLLGRAKELYCESVCVEPKLIESHWFRGDSSPTKSPARKAGLVFGGVAKRAAGRLPGIPVAADASVFPFATDKTSTLPIMAFALRTSEHIVRRLREGTLG